MSSIHHAAKLSQYGLTTGLGYCFWKKASLWAFVSNVVINTTSKAAEDKLILYKLAESLSLVGSREVKDCVVRDGTDEKTIFTLKDKLIQNRNKE